MILAYVLKTWISSKMYSCIKKRFSGELLQNLPSDRVWNEMIQMNESETRFYFVQFQLSSIRIYCSAICYVTNWTFHTQAYYVIIYYVIDNDSEGKINSFKK